jgi:hypothetical protein
MKKVTFIVDVYDEPGGYVAVGNTGSGLADTSGPAYKTQIAAVRAFLNNPWLRHNFTHWRSTSGKMYKI